MSGPESPRSLSQSIKAFDFENPSPEAITARRSQLVNQANFGLLPYPDTVKAAIIKAMEFHTKLIKLQERHEDAQKNNPNFDNALYEGAITHGKTQIAKQAGIIFSEGFNDEAGIMTNNALTPDEIKLASQGEQKRLHHTKLGEVSVIEARLKKEAEERRKRDEWREKRNPHPHA